MRAVIGYAASHIDGAKRFLAAKNRQPGANVSHGFAEFFNNTYKEPKDKSSSVFTYEVSETEFFRAKKRMYFINKIIDSVPSSNDHDLASHVSVNNTRLKTGARNNNGIDYSVNKQVFKTKEGKVIKGGKAAIKSIIEFSKLNDIRHEPYHKRIAHVKWAFTEELRRHTTVVDAPSLWLKPFKNLKTNKPRWVPKRNTSEEKIVLLEDRIKSLAGMYIPYSNYRVQLIAREGVAYDDDEEIGLGRTYVHH